MQGRELGTVETVKDLGVHVTAMSHTKRQIGCLD